MAKQTPKPAAKKPASSKGSKGPAPVTSVRLSSANGPERTVDVRKIENGYVVRESCYDPKKGYTSTERFSAKAPEIKVDGAGLKSATKK